MNVQTGTEFSGICYIKANVSTLYFSDLHRQHLPVSAQVGCPVFDRDDSVMP